MNQKYERMFCSGCKRYTVHQRGEFEYECLHCMRKERSAELALKDELQRFTAQMQQFTAISDVLAFYKIASERLRVLIDSETHDLQKFTNGLMRYVEKGGQDAA